MGIKTLLLLLLLLLFKLLKIKHESMPFFAIASHFVTFFGTGMPKSLTQSL